MSLENTSLMKLPNDVEKYEIEATKMGQNYSFFLCMSEDKGFRHLGDRLCVSTKDGTRGGGWVSRRVQTAWPCLSLARKALVGLGRLFLSCFVQNLMGLENSLLALQGFCFWQWSFISVHIFSQEAWLLKAC